jgi:hypothetical protein
VSRRYPPGSRAPRYVPLLCAATLALAGACTADAGSRGQASSPPPAASTSVTAGPARPTRSSSPAPSPVPTRPAVFDNRAAMATIRSLSESIGPRETTSAAYRRAAALVDSRLRRLGYAVRRQSLRVPAGVSWGVPVPAGRTVNVIAEPPGFRMTARHLLVGAQLDTVPQAPGANDNASGVAVMLELARLAMAGPPPVPVVFVAFAAEEPRGPTDNDHHYGSRAYVAAMTPAARRGLIGMISVDRVGLGTYVPVCTGGRSPRTVAAVLLAQARRLGIPARACRNRTSDHWSFERAGLTAVRVGGWHPDPAYHTPRDRIGVIEPARLHSVGVLTWQTVRTMPR